MKFELDLSNYATKADLKNATIINKSKLVINLPNLKFNKDNLDIDKLKYEPTNLSSLNSRVYN